MLLSSDGMLMVSPPARETPLLAETSFLGAMNTDDAEDVLTTGGLPNTDPTIQHNMSQKKHNHM